jgi:hypothetical protein
LDVIPIDKNTGAEKIQKAYGKSLPDRSNEIRSIMERAITPEWAVNVLALGKENWHFKDDQLNMYRQQWQADRQNQIIANMAEKMPGKSNDGKRKHSERNPHNNNGGRSGGHQGNISQGGRKLGRGGHGERGKINSDHLKTIECYNCGKKVPLQLIAPQPKKTRIKTQTYDWVIQYGPLNLLIKCELATYY